MAYCCCLTLARWITMVLIIRILYLPRYFARVFGFFFHLWVFNISTNQLNIPGCCYALHQYVYIYCSGHLSGLCSWSYFLCCYTSESCHITVSVTLFIGTQYFHTCWSFFAVSWCTDKFDNFMETIMLGQALIAYQVCSVSLALNLLNASKQILFS